MTYRQRPDNRTDPAFLARWEPWRNKIRPAECDLGEHGLCWVKEPYQALEGPGAGKRCKGCGGLVGDLRLRRVGDSVGGWREG